jgi:hypothetical protein
MEAEQNKKGDEKWDFVTDMNQGVVIIVTTQVVAIAMPPPSNVRPRPMQLSYAMCLTLAFAGVVNHPVVAPV